jgi:chemotaxis protein CheC
METLRSLNPNQLDALREVANIGAGHAATALSQMIGETIMISVPTISVAPMDEVPPQVAPPDEPLAVVLMQMVGDLTGRTLLVFPRRTAQRLAGMLMGRAARLDARDFTEMEQSAIKEAGNILSSAYMNALSEFMGMLLLPTPPSLAVEVSTAALSANQLQFGGERDYVFCVESEFLLDETDESLRGYFLLLPDRASLHEILKAIRVA